MKLIDDEIAKYERQAREAHADADQTRDGFRRDFARQCEAKARQWRELRDNLSVGVPDGWKLVPVSATREQKNSVCMHPDLAAVLYSNMVKAAPTVKAEQLSPGCCGTPENCPIDYSRCPHLGQPPAPSLPAAGSADVGKFSIQCGVCKESSTLDDRKELSGCCWACGYEIDLDSQLRAALSAQGVNVAALHAFLETWEVAAAEAFEYSKDVDVDAMLVELRTLLNGGGGGEA